jgi:acetoin utilization deacetylase AcuC-like enzyme
MATYLCSDDAFLRHKPLGEHPECPERLSAILSAIRGSDLRGRTVPLKPRRATDEELRRVHAVEYLADLRQRMGEVNPRGSGWLDPDTYYGPGTYQAALLAAGGTTELALKVLRSQPQPGSDPASARTDNGFALVRPPGHHARRDRAMGFCLLNNIAVAAAAARAQGARVAIVDFDVHHGNGTEEMFARDSSVLFISLHQFPYYPGTGAATFAGEGAGRGSTLNVPMPEGSGGPEYKLAFQKIVLPALRRFEPDLILVSAGFDAHARDPLAGMNLVEQDYARMIHALLLVQPRLVAVLEGGYHLESLGQSAVAVLRVLLDPASFTETGHDAGERPSEAARARVTEVQRLHNL